MTRAAVIDIAFQEMMRLLIENIISPRTRRAGSRTFWAYVESYYAAEERFHASIRHFTLHFIYTAYQQPPSPSRDILLPSLPLYALDEYASPSSTIRRLI